MKGRLCGNDLDPDIHEGEDDKTVGYKIPEVYNNDLCLNCRYRETYGHIKKTRENNTLTTITTIEYIYHV